LSSPWAVPGVDLSTPPPANLSPTASEAVCATLQLLLQIKTHSGPPFGKGFYFLEIPTLRI